MVITEQDRSCVPVLLHHSPKIMIIILAKNSLQSYNKKNERRRSRVDPHTNHIINNTKTNNQ